MFDDWLNQFGILSRCKRVSEMMELTYFSFVLSHEARQSVKQQCPLVYLRQIKFISDSCKIYDEHNKSVARIGSGQKRTILAHCVSTQKKFLLVVIFYNENLIIKTGRLLEQCYYVCFMQKAFFVFPYLKLAIYIRIFFLILLLATATEHFWWPSSFDTVDKRYFSTNAFQFSIRNAMPFFTSLLSHISLAGKDDKFRLFSRSESLCCRAHL